MTSPNDQTAKDEIGLLEVLRVLIDTKKARTTADLLKYATQYHAPEAEERLRMLEAENIPLELAFDAVSVHLRLLVYKRSSSLLADCRDKKVGLILPLPPHLAQLFVPVAKVSYLQPAEGSLHGAFHDLAAALVKGSRPCRAEAQKMDALVFEAYRDASGLFADVATADVIEPKMLPAGIKLIAHLRPHRNPQDVAIAPGTVAFI